MASKFYEKEKVIGEVALPRGEKLRLMVAEKAGIKYVDVRVWYEDDNGDLKPGKGIGKPEKFMRPILELIQTMSIEQILEGEDTYTLDVESNLWTIKE